MTHSNWLKSAVLLWAAVFLTFGCGPSATVVAGERTALKSSSQRPRTLFDRMRSRDAVIYVPGRLPYIGSPADPLVRIDPVTESLWGLR